MANWSKRKVDSSEINKGQEYTKDDNVSVEELNAIVNNSFNAQGEAEKSLNTVKGFQIGTAISGDTAGANINVDTAGERIILNLVLPKGEKGDKGDKGDSGSFGTMNYSELSNKPQINGKELNGNLTTEDLGIETISEKEIDDKLDKKVDKVEGKGLSTNDFTNEEKSKLLGLNNYDDSEIKESINNLQNNKANINDLGALAFKDTLSKSDVGLNNVNNTSDLNKPISTATQEALNLKANSKDLSAVATSGSYNDLKNKPTIPNVENFITKDVNNLTNYTLSTGVGTAIDLSVDTTNYKITVSLKNSSGTVLSSDVVDLPLESVVVSGSYDSTNKKVVLTLQNGSSIDFSVADLVSGLASQSSLNTTNDNVSKLSTRVGNAETNISNLQSNKVDKVSGKGLSTNDYTTAEKTKLSGIAEGAEVNVQSDWNATSGDAFIKNKPTLFSGNYNDLTNKPTIPTVPVQSVNSKTGTVVLTQDDVGDGTTYKRVTSGEKNTWNAKANSDDVVKLTGNQTISGTKTFSDGINLGSAINHDSSTGSIGINGDVLNTPNLNEITQRGIYHCTKGTNTPTFDQANSSYDLMVFNSSEYDSSGNGSSLITQMVNVGWKWWIRRKDSSSWGAWERFGQSTTPNNGKLTIQKNGTQIGTFTANQSGNSTINIQAIDSDDTVYQFAQDEYNKSLNLSQVNSRDTGNFNLNANIEAGKQYTISFYCNGYRSFNLKKNDNSGATIKTSYDVNGQYQYTFTADWTGDIYINAWASSTTPTGNSYSDIMVNEGSVALPYQPYQGGKIVHKGDIQNSKAEQVWSGSAYTSGSTLTIPNYDSSYLYLIEFWGYSSQWKTTRVLHVGQYGQYTIQGDSTQFCRYRLENNNGVITISSNGTTGNASNTAIVGIYKVKGGTV